ncbi:unnamed protein product, partial [Ixodes persulcatus]
WNDRAVHLKSAKQIKRHFFFFLTIAGIFLVSKEKKSLTGVGTMRLFHVVQSFRITGILTRAGCVAHKVVIFFFFSIRSRIYLHSPPGPIAVLILQKSADWSRCSSSSHTMVKWTPIELGVCLLFLSLYPGWRARRRTCVRVL